MICVHFFPQAISVGRLFLSKIRFDLRQAHHALPVKYLDLCCWNIRALGLLFPACDVPPPIPLSDVLKTKQVILLCDEVRDVASSPKAWTCSQGTARLCRFTSFLKAGQWTDISSLSFSSVGFIFQDTAAQVGTEVSSNESRNNKCQLWKPAQPKAHV